MQTPLPGVGDSADQSRYQVFYYENTAGRENLRASLGLLPANIYDAPVTQVFSQIDWHGKWKYNSNPSNPTIPPLIQLRTAAPTTSDADDDVLEMRQELLQRLPPNISQELLRQQSLPPENRSGSYTALSSFLDDASSFLAALKAAARAPSESEIASSHADANLLLLAAGLSGMVEQSHDLLGSLKPILNNLVSNHPQMERIKGYSDEFEEVLNRLAELSLNGGTRDEFTEVAGRLDLLAEQMGRVPIQGDFQILESLTHAAQLLASAISTGETLASSYLAFSLAYTGATDPNSSTYPLDPAFASLVSNMSDMMMGLNPQSTSASRNLIGLLLTSWLGSTVGSLIQKQNSGSPDLALKLSLIAGSQSGLFEAVGSILAEVANVPPSDVPIVSKGLALATILTLVKQGTKDDVDAAKEWISDLQPYIEPWMQAIAPKVAEYALANPENLGLQQLDLFLSQGLIALKKDKMDDFVASLTAFKDYGLDENSFKGTDKLFVLPSENVLKEEGFKSETVLGNI